MPELMPLEEVRERLAPATGWRPDPEVVLIATTAAEETMRRMADAETAALRTLLAAELGAYTYGRLMGWRMLWFDYAAERAATRLISRQNREEQGWTVEQAAAVAVQLLRGYADGVDAVSVVRRWWT